MGAETAVGFLLLILAGAASSFIHAHLRKDMLEQTAYSLREAYSGALARTATEHISMSKDLIEHHEQTGIPALEEAAVELVYQCSLLRLRALPEIWPFVFEIGRRRARLGRRGNIGLDDETAIRKDIEAHL